MPEMSAPISSKIHYRVMGSGPALLLLHGFPESGTLWRGIWDKLATSYTLVIPDLPGSGKTLLDQGTSISQMAEGIKVLLDAEGIDKAVIAGHSMGGYVALSLAHLYPEKIAGLSLVHSSPLADDEEKKINRQKVIEVVSKGAREAFLRQMVPGLFSEDFKRREPALVEEQVNNALEMNTESIVNFYTAMLNREDRRDVLDTASFPVQWILGEEDTIVPLEKILPLCNRAQVNSVSIYGQCSHMSMVETPAALARDILTFAKLCYNV